MAEDTKRGSSCWMHRELEQTSTSPHGGFSAAPALSAFNAPCLLTARRASGEPVWRGRKAKVSQYHSHNLEFETNADENIIITEHPLGSGSKIPFIHLKCQDLQVQEISKCLSRSLFVCKWCCNVSETERPDFHEHQSKYLSALSGKKYFDAFRSKQPKITTRILRQFKDMKSKMKIVQNHFSFQWSFNFYFPHVIQILFHKWWSFKIKEFNEIFQFSIDGQWAVLHSIPCTGGNWDEEWNKLRNGHKQ